MIDPGVKVLIEDATRAQLADALRNQTGTLVLSMGYPGHAEQYALALEVSRAILDEFEKREREKDHR